MAVLVVGESLVDVVIGPDGAQVDSRPGGAPLNIAVGLSRLGVPTRLLTTFADDEYGALVVRHAEESGVHLVAAGHSTRPTSVARARLDTTHQATYEFELHWDPRAIELPDDVDLLHVGSLGTVVAPGDRAVHDLVRRARAAGVPVTYDPNVRPTVSPDPAVAWAGVRRWAADADVVKMSDDDAAYLCPGAAADDVLDLMLEGERTALAVLTQGAGGTTLSTASTRVHVPAPRVEVVDTVGAGDAFMSGLVAALVDGDHLHGGGGGGHGLESLAAADLHRLGAYAAAVAALTCTRRGADPPRRGDLEAV